MKTNHPAHGPVSLDRLHQIREILSKAAAQSDGGNIGYAMTDAVKVIDEVLERRQADKPPVHPTIADEKLDDETLQELIEFRRSTFEYHSKEGNKVQTIIHGVVLSALLELQERRNGSPEPVADVVAWSSPNEERTCDICWRRHDVSPGPLYTTPPSMIVPDEMAISDGMNIYQKRFALGHNACRAAMLQAGNSPVAPDTWIPVSERMPERDVDVQVYCADKKEQMVGYMERNETDGWFRFASLPNGGGVYCKPTHWMPLPAAPQQEVKP
ncbi:DUF551 domain-containing protein [Salmonella enterica subsp. enterica serovar Newport]|uniref:DUF551 domain-containing protein n=1 Tax=Salmonella enterica TaxID=28901 RepID=A0A746UT05_SALER|nr:DUF551 domain-containing protein [Salmonella enterica]